MREIKFRAWDKNKDKMYEVVKINWCSSAVWYKGIGDKYIGNLGTHEFGAILMQYTGLKDVTGREIYEGDIVKYKGVVSAPNDRFGQKYTEILQVEFVNGCFEPFDRPFTESKNIQIIGNIYENKEFLNDPTRP